MSDARRGASDLLDLRLREFLDALAAEGPIPAGGAAAAIAVAMAASLTAMAARTSPDWPAAGATIAQAAALRARVEPLALRDAEAYAEVLAALRLPEDLGDDERQAVLAGALARAAELPLSIAEAAADAAELASHAAEHCSDRVRGDALAAALLAEGAAAAAARLVEINLAAGAGDPRSTRARALSDAASVSAQRALSAIG